MTETLEERIAYLEGEYQELLKAVSNAELVVEDALAEADECFQELRGCRQELRKQAKA